MRQAKHNTSDRSQPTAIPTPALDRWRQEVGAGSRQRNTRDALWRAACLEHEATEHDQMGHVGVAEAFLADAARLYVGAGIIKLVTDDGPQRPKVTNRQAPVRPPTRRAVG